MFHGTLIIMIAVMMMITETSIVEVNKDYIKLPHIGQRIINSLRLTQGAFTEGSKGINEMSLGEINLFFVVRIMSLFIANMIFMTFIVGKIMTEYFRLRGDIDILIERQRISLIRDAHDIYGRRTSNKNWFPKFIIIRQQET